MIKNLLILFSFLGIISCDSTPNEIVIKDQIYFEVDHMGHGYGEIINIETNQEGTIYVVRLHNEQTIRIYERNLKKIIRVNK